MPPPPPHVMPQVLRLDIAQHEGKTEREAQKQGGGDKGERCASGRVNYIA